MSVLGMKRISKRVRDEAILICSVVASGDIAPPRPCPCVYCVAKWLDFDRDVQALAEAAREATQLRCDTDAVGRYGMVFAEAECLLRSGWSPE